MSRSTRRSPSFRTVSTRSAFRTLLLVGTTGAGLLGTSSPVQATDDVWVYSGTVGSPTSSTATTGGGTANYDAGTTGYWSQNAKPAANNFDAIINNGGTVLITAAETPNDLRTGNVAGGSGNYIQSAGIVTMSNGWFRLGSAASTTLAPLSNYSLNGGNIALTGSGQQFNVAEMAFTNAQMTLAGGSVAASGVSLLQVGNGASSVGALTINTGSTFTMNPAIAASVIIGNNALSSGTLSVGGGTFNFADTGIGTFVVGNAATSVGVVNVSSGTLSFSATVAGSNNGANTAIGSTGKGTLNITGGTVNLTPTAGGYPLAIGRASGANGTVNISAGTLNVGTSAVPQEMWIGNSPNATALFSQTGGTTNVTSWLAVGRNTNGGGNGTLNLSGGVLNAAINGGNVTLSGTSTASIGVTNVTGGTLNTPANIYVTEGGVSTLSISGTGVVSETGTSGVIVNTTASSNGTTTGTVNLGNGTVGGGTLSVNNVNSTNTVAARSIFNFNGGILQAKVANTNFFATSVGIANVLNGGAIIDSNGVNITIPKALIHGTAAAAIDGGLTKNGAGVLTLSGANTYTGPTTVNTGTLTSGNVAAIPANTALAASAAVNFNGQYVQAAGSATPGLTLTTLTAGAASRFTFTLNATGADYVAFSGAATVAAGAGLTVSSPTGVTLTPGTYNLFTATSGLDTFTLTNNNVITNGLYYPLSLSATPTADVLTVGTGQVAKLYYTGATSNSLNVAANFSTDLPGTIAATALPTSIVDLYFTATNATQNFTTTLGGLTAANSLEFSGTAGNPAATNPISITGPGTLTLGAIQNTFTAGTGIVVDSGAAAVTISANLALGASQSYTNNSANLFTVSGGVDGGGNYALTLAGTGAQTLTGVLSNLTGVTDSAGGLVTLTNTNTFTGPLVLAGSGFLNFASTNNLGATGNIVRFSGGNLQYATGNTADISTSHQLVLNGNAGIDTNGSNVTFASPITVTGVGYISKLGGTGNLTLSGGLTYSGVSNIGSVFVQQGALTFTGAGEAVNTAGNYNSIGQLASNRGTLSILNGATFTTTSDLNLGDVGGTTLATVNGGIVNLSGTGSAITENSFFVGKGTSTTAQYGYGVFNQSGGTHTSNGNSQVGAFGLGQYNFTGGTWTRSAGFLSVARQPGSFGVLDVNGGTFTDNAPGNRSIIGELGTGVLNVRNGGVFNANTSTTNNNGTGLTAGLASLTLGNTAGTAASPTLGIANLLAGGTINTQGVGSLTGAAAGTISSQFNFNGGTLKNTVANATLMQNLTTANVYTGGALIDTTAGNATIAQSLLAPAGNGVNAITATGTGFATTPIVQITGGGGTGATAVATVDATGTLTGITITNPGINYTSAPTVTITGPFGTQVIGTATIAANDTTGGLTKLGANTLILTGTNTFGGAATISAGALQLGAGGTTGSFPTTTSIVDNGGLIYNHSDNTTFPNTIPGTGTFEKQGTGTLVLSATNTYTGKTTISAGILSVADIENGGVNSTIGASSADPANLVLQGSGNLLYTGPATTTNRGFTVGAGTAGTTGLGGPLIDNAVNLTFGGQILASGNGSLTKNGAGTLAFTNTTGTNTLTGGGTGNGLGLVVNNGLVQLGGTAAAPLNQTNVINGEVSIGTINSAASPNAALEINGGTTTITSYLGIGRGNGTNNAATSVTLNNNAVVTAGNYSMGFNNGVSGYTSSPTFTLNGSSSFTDSGVFTVGESVNGTGGISTVNINGTASVTTTNATGGVNVGLNSAGTVNQNGGTVTFASPATFGNNSTGAGIYNLAAGTLNARNILKGGGAGTLNFTGGTLVATASDNPGTGTGTYSFLTGVTATAANGTSAIINSNGFTVTASASIGGAGGLMKIGAGQLNITGPNTYSGATAISNGTLNVDNGSTTPLTTAGSLSATSAIAVTNGGTLLLSGSSSVNNRLNDAAPVTLNGSKLALAGVAEGGGNAGALAPTGAVGVGALTLQGASIIDLQGTSLLHLADSSAQNWAGGTLAIYNYSGQTVFGGGMEQLLFGTTDSSLTPTQLSQISFYSDNGTTYLGPTAFAGLGDGEIVPVPEPAAWLAGALTLGLLGYARRRQVAGWLGLQRVA